MFAVKAMDDGWSAPQHQNGAITVNSTMSSFMQDTRDPEENLVLLELLGEG